MQARMKNPVFVIPEVLDALRRVGAITKNTSLPVKTQALVHLRASQLNGCSVCVDMHSRELKQEGDSDERIIMVSAWRESPLFSDAERAALALTEAVTRLSDRTHPVPDAVWNEAARHYDEGALAALVLHIAQINLWNRINVTVRQMAA